MWHYFWAHMVYHVVRWLPKNNRLKIRVVLGFFSLALLVPQIFVLAHPHTDRVCHEPLLDMLIVSIVFTFCMLGFSLLFAIMEPVHWKVKIVFHVFGFGGFIVTLLLLVFTGKAKDCSNITEALYYFSVAGVVLSSLTMVFVLVMAPFWLYDKWRPNTFLDRRGREGLCYEPVACCSCVWHI